MGKKIVEKGAARIMALNLQQMMIEGREAKGWKQEEASRETGISQPQISRFERGEKLPIAEDLMTLIEVYGLPEKETWNLYQVALEQIGISDLQRAVLKAFESGRADELFALFRQYHSAKRKKKAD